MSYPEIFNGEENLFEIFLFSHDYKKLHRHNYIEFIYVIEGRGIEQVNNEIRPLERGVLSIILPYQYHLIKQDDNNLLRYYSVAVSMDYLMQSSNRSMLYTETFEMLDSSYEPLIFQDGSFKVMEKVLTSMFGEFQHKKSWWQESVRASLVTLFIAINRELKTIVKEDSGSNKKIDKDQIIWKIMQYMYCHFDEDISLKQLSHIFNINSAYISSRVKEVTGQNYYDFLTDIRLKNAMSLIKTSDMKMVDVAHASGYQSYRSFVRAFEKRYNKSPGEYKT